MVTDPLITLEMLAARLGVSTRTARRIMDRGDIPKYRIGGCVRVRSLDVDTYIKGSRVEQATQSRSALKELVANAVKRAREKNSKLKTESGECRASNSPLEFQRKEHCQQNGTYHE